MRAEFIPSQKLLQEAETIVDSHEVLSVFAACEWDCLGDDGKVWIAAIVKLAQDRARGLTADIVDVPVLPIQLVNMPRRSEDPRLSRGNDNGADFVGSDGTNA